MCSGTLGPPTAGARAPRTRPASWHRSIAAVARHAAPTSRAWMPTTSRSHAAGRQVEFLDRHPAVAVVGSAVVRIDAAGREIKRNTCPTTHAEIVEALQQYTCFTHPTVMCVRRRSRPSEATGRPIARPRITICGFVSPSDTSWRTCPTRCSTIGSIRTGLGAAARQQVLSVVGARAAARQRMRHGQRPKSRTRADLGGAAERVGCSGDRAGGRHGRGLSLRRLCDGAGRAPDEALDLLRKASGSQGPRRPGPMLAGACSKRARTAFREGRVWAGLSWGMQAWRAQPSLPSAFSKVGSRGAEYGRTRRSTGVTGPRVPVLMYHEVSASPHPSLRRYTVTVRRRSPARIAGSPPSAISRSTWMCWFGHGRGQGHAARAAGGDHLRRRFRHVPTTRCPSSRRTGLRRCSIWSRD